MKFEHHITIDAHFFPALQGQNLDPAALWRGLIWRAKSPQDFLDNLDQVHILYESDSMLRRELHFGSMRVVDQIEFDHAQTTLRQYTEASEQHHGGELEIRCVFPEKTQNCPPEIHFVYQNALPENNDEEKYYANYLKNIYQMMDREAINKIITAILNSEI